MYTSYEQRLEFLHQFIDGSLAYHKNLPNAKLTKGDGVSKRATTIRERVI